MVEENLWRARVLVGLLLWVRIGKNSKVMSSRFDKKKIHFKFKQHTGVFGTTTMPSAAIPMLTGSSTTVTFPV